jgi:8-hydroxy-5-deazaflavin:NADPH oxidoreductase
MADALADAFVAAGRTIERIGSNSFLSEDQRPSALSADVMFIIIPWRMLERAIQLLARSTERMVLVNCIAAIDSDDRGFFISHVPEGSVTAALAKAWPLARIVGALNQFTADHLKLATLGTLRTDVPVVGDDREATDLVEALIDELRGLEGVYAGPLRTAAAIEGMTALLREAEVQAGHPLGFRFLEGGGLRLLD